MMVMIIGHQFPVEQLSLGSTHKSRMQPCVEHVRTFAKTTSSQQEKSGLYRRCPYMVSKYEEARLVLPDPIFIAKAVVNNREVTPKLGIQGFSP